MQENKVESDIGTYVVSYGGQGSKLVTKLLHEGKDASFLERAHVHWRYPPAGEASDDTKFVYVFGDPRNTVISFFQRRVTRHAQHGFSPPENAIVSMPKFVQWSLRNLQCQNTDVPQDLDLEGYLAQSQTDIFELEDHIRRWLDRGRDLDIAFVRYEALWSDPKAVESLVGIAPVTIPPFVPRRADWTSLANSHQRQITELYKSAVALVESLPDVFHGREYRTQL